MVKLDNVTYDKVKLLQELSSMIWFIEKHAKNDAKNSGNKDFLECLNHLEKDLQKYIEQIQQNMCIITQ